MNDINRIIAYVFVDLNNRQSYSKVVLIYQSIPEFIPYQHTWIYTSFIRNNGAILFLAKISPVPDQRGLLTLLGPLNFMNVSCSMDPRDTFWTRWTSWNLIIRWDYPIQDGRRLFLKKSKIYCNKTIMVGDTLNLMAHSILQIKFPISFIQSTFLIGFTVFEIL